MSSIQPIAERVYDRLNPNREGTATWYWKNGFQYWVVWDDLSESGWVKIDNLGAVNPPDVGKFGNPPGLGPGERWFESNHPDYEQ